MKRFLMVFAIIWAALCIVVPVMTVLQNTTAFAAASQQQTADPNENVNITVVMPVGSTDKQSPRSGDENSTPTPKLNYSSVYPSDVWEFQDDSGRQIIKIYELSAGENPAGISRDSFERDGWRYELTDITKRETASAESREHVETVTVDTASREMDEILAQLAPTIDYQSDDGYIGVLTLDINSIAVETGETKKSNYTMTATREYPHLSSNDTALVPKSITQNGATYTLSNVVWRTQGTESVDYDSIPTSYTAVAKYTASGSRTTVSGYITTAEYRGAISKVLTGKTVYTAYFIGTELKPPATVYVSQSHDEPEAETTPAPDSDESVESSTPSTIETTVTSIQTTEPMPTHEPEKKSSAWVFILIIIALVLMGGGWYYYRFLRKPVRVEPENTDISIDESEDDTQ